ncbi:uncharacterized protein LOC119615910 [Lucilia sericata]|uniref:uncharacterized protein LOC119615910 n=1 Tax=Lucilia sericata TaxID=13632 RepID=UPI0018A846FE|nr:uncharacterized protein LOC119615910 [Lucilia sericata]
MKFLTVINDFKELGCNQQAQCAVACRIYLDLISDKKYSSVDKCYDNTLQILFFKAENHDKKKFIILPSLIAQELDLNIINKLNKKELNDGSFLLALCDTSSNILYYRLFEDQR